MLIATDSDALSHYFQHFITTTFVAMDDYFKGMNLDQIKKHECEQEEKCAKEKIEAKWRMYERQKKQNDEFVWSPENVAKIIHLNDKLWALMHEADRIGKSIYNDIQKLIDGGKDYYDKPIEVEVGIFYRSLAILAKDADAPTLYDSVAPLTYANGYGLEDVCDIDYSIPMNWNVGVFNRPEFKDIYICFLMHWHFNRGLYSLQDAVTMDPGKFYISTTIHNELNF